MKDLHPIQQKLIDILKRTSGDPLTIRELQDELTVSSPSVVQHHLFQLEKKGFLRRNPSNPRDYQILSDSPDKRITFLNLYGLAQCGPNGSILDGNPIERIPISSKLLGFPSSEAFMVKARGESMIPVIHPGDLILVKRTKDAANGAMVVCVNNGVAIIKKIQKISGPNNSTTYNLISENREFQPFTASDDFRIEGVVRGVISYSV